MEVIVARQGALDVHKAQVTACARVPGTDGGRVQHVKQFKTTVGGLLVLSDWLKAHGVTHVVMEATGDFWKPVWHILESDFELMLVKRPRGQEPSGPQDRHQGRRVALPARGGGASAGELRARPSRSGICGF